MSRLRWNLVRIAFFVVATLGFIFPLELFPMNLVPIGAVATIVGILFAGWSIAKGDKWWGNGALVVGGTVLGAAIVFELVAGSILSAIPALLFTYVILLFSAEGFALVNEHYVTQSKMDRSTNFSYPMLKSSLEHVTRKSSRLALVFGGCFVISLAAISSGDAFATVAPGLADLSIYIVAVTVSLALLLTFHED